MPTTRVLAHPAGSTGRKQGPFLKSILAGLHPADLHILLLPSSSCPCDVSGTLGPFVIIKVCSVGYLLLEKVSPPMDTSHDYVQGLCFTFALWVFLEDYFHFNNKAYECVSVLGYVHTRADRSSRVV